MFKFNSFAKSTIVKSYNGLEEQAYANIRSGVDYKLEKINNMINRIQQLTKRVADSANIPWYLNAENRVMLNAKTEASQCVNNLIELCDVQYKMVTEKINLGLYCLEYILQLVANPYLSTTKKMVWKTINQFTGNNINMELPVMVIGTQEVKKIYSYEDEFSPFVDDVQEMTGVNCSIFQKINENGDMLRIATNVKNKHGKRAIETIIPAILPDGSPNPILFALNKGQDYKGLVIEVNDEFFAMYRPFFNDSGRVIGAFFIGVPAIDKNLFHSIAKNKITQSGYSFIFNGQGDIIYHPKKEFINKNIIDDLNMKTFKDVLVNKNTKGVQTHFYSFENKRQFMSYLYFSPRDWFVCVSLYLDDIVSEEISHSRMIFENELKTIFKSQKMKINHQEYDLLNQIRFFYPNGMEWIKVVHGELSNQYLSKASFDWFSIAINQNTSGSVNNHGVCVSTNTGKTELCITSPVFFNNKVAGLIAINVNWQIVEKILSERIFRQSEYAFIINEKGMLIAHPHYGFKDQVFLIDSSFGELSQIVKNNMLKGKSGQVSYSLNGKDHLIYYVPFMCGKKQYSLCATGLKDDYLHMANRIRIDAENGFTSILRIIIFSIITCTGLAIMVAIIVGQNISRPLENVVGFAQKVSEGDLSTTLKTKRSDEISYLLTAINKMVISFRKIVSDIKSHANHLSGSSEEIVKLASVLSNNSESMNDRANHVTGTSSQMSSDIHTIAQRVQDMSKNVSNVSNTTQQISKNINTMSLSIGEMSQTITHVGEQAHKGTSITEHAVITAENTNDKMISLKKAAKEIGVVSQMIKRVAYKTNLIAMNADIEASSAGEAGKGFAVVAKTIKDFAKQNKQAANDIDIRINAVQDGVNHAMSSIEDVLKIIKEINYFVETIFISMNKETKNADRIASQASEVDDWLKDIVKSMSELSIGAKKISENVSNMAKGADGVAKNIKDVSEATNNSAKQIHHVNSQALELDHFATNLNTLVSGYKVL